MNYVEKLCARLLGFGPRGRGIQPYFLCAGLLGFGAGGRGIQPYFSCTGLLGFGSGGGVSYLIFYVQCF